MRMTLFQAKKAAKLEKFKEKQQKKPTDTKDSKPKEAKSTKTQSAAKDAVIGKKTILFRKRRLKVQDNEGKIIAW